ncbi:hypothetical protein ACLOJK_020525 [Asimina triloba]
MGDVLWNLEYALQLEETSSALTDMLDNSTNHIAEIPPPSITFTLSSALTDMLDSSTNHIAESPSIPPFDNSVNMIVGGGTDDDVDDVATTAAFSQLQYDWRHKENRQQLAFVEVKWLIWEQIELIAAENKREEEEAVAADSHSSASSDHDDHHHQPSPCLVIHHGQGHKKQSFFNVSSGKHWVRSMPEAREIPKPRRRESGSYSNVLSRAKIILPPLKPKPFIKTCVWSLPPDDPDCMVYVFYSGQPHLHYCRPHDKEWKRQELDADLRCFRSAVALTGKVYLQTDCGKKLAHVLQVDPVPTVKEIHVRMTPRFRGCLAGNYLLECGGDIFQVRLLYYGLQPIVRGCAVYKLDLVGRRWEKVESIGDHVFFLGDIWSISHSASELKIKGNRIYYTQSYDLSLYSFDLEDGSIAADLPWPNLRPPWEYSYWVLA